MANQQLKFIISVDSKPGISNLKKFEKATLDTTAKVSGAFKKMSKTIAAATAAIFGAAFIKGTKDMIKLYGEFEKSLANVSTLVDTSAVDMEKLKQQILDLPSALGSAKENTDALYQAISAGVEPAKAVAFVAEAAKAAAAGLTTTFTSLEGGTTVLNSYGLEAENITSIFDQMFIAVKAGKTTFEELASSIGKVSPIASAAGVNTQELFSAIATLTKQGIRTKESVTALKQAFSNVIKPGSDATKMAEDLGIKFNAIELKAKGLKGFLDEIKKATGGNVAVMSKLFGSVEALNAILALTSDKGAKDFNDILQEMSKGGIGVTAEAFEKQSKTFSRSMTTIKTSLEKLAIVVGSKVIPPLASMLNKISDFIDRNREFIASKIVKVYELFGAAWMVIKDTFKLLLPILKPVFHLFEIAADVLKTFLRILDKVIKALQPFMNFLGTILNTVVNVIRKIVTLGGLIGDSTGGDEVEDRLRKQIKFQKQAEEAARRYQKEVSKLNDIWTKEIDLTDKAKAAGVTVLTAKRTDVTFWSRVEWDTYHERLDKAKKAFQKAMAEIRQDAEEAGVAVGELTSSFTPLAQAQKEITTTTKAINDQTNAIKNLNDVQAVADQLIQKHIVLEAEMRQQMSAFLKESALSKDLSTLTAADFLPQKLPEGMELLRIYTQSLRDYENQAKRLNELSQRMGGDILFSFYGEGSSIMPLGDKITQMGSMFGNLFNEVGEDRAVKFSFEDSAGNSLTTAFDTVQRGFEGMFDALIDGTLNVKESFKQLTVDILRNVSKMLANRAIAELIGLLATSIGGSLGGGTPYIPGLQTGGTAIAGNPYIVGERGPELFIPGKTGQVVPGNKIGGSGEVNVVNNITINNQGTSGNERDDRKMAKQVSRAVEDRIKEVIANQRRPGGLLNPNQAIPRRA